MIEFSTEQLTELYKQWTAMERDRIIKLLEAERWTLPDGTLADGEIYLPIEQAITLIKGENK